MMNFWSDLTYADPYGYGSPEDNAHKESDYENHIDDEYHKLKDEGEIE